MKLYSLPGYNPSAADRSVRAEVVASEGGRSLVLLNGMPVAADGELTAGQSMTGRLAATDGGFKIIAADNSGGVTVDKMLENAGIHESGPALINTMKSYGLAITQANLRSAAELLPQLPGGAAERINLQIVSLILARRLNASAIPVIRDYLLGNLNFSKLFSGLSAALQKNLQLDWSHGKLLELLQQIIRRGADAMSADKAAKLPEELVTNLQMQEMLAIAPQAQAEGRMYFQWPVFWHEQDIPDTLEGEASVPPPGSEQGFSLRLLVSPPSMGQIEIAMHQLNKSLWVHFGAQAEFLDDIRSVFPLLHERLARGDFAQVNLTAGRIRNLTNFFAAEPESEKISLKPVAGLDIKV